MQQQNMGERTPQGTPRHAGPKPLNTPEELRAALDAGAFAAVVGGAITRPKQITERFVDALKK